ncbi:SUMF1/EgtB/PvdO family nonheme iron enzyme [Pontiellaceae bacterium B1224]|nr:SUMF1/EgtB/PvdO family nonheme iron enzyme [Pontiellaceae bacterium B1224]
MKIKWMLIGLIPVLGSSVQAVVTVENTVAAQVTGTKTVTVGYDVSSDFAGAVTITLRAFDGEDEVPLSALSGDVGAGVVTGTGKSIVWDAGADWYGQHTAGLKFLVVADDGQDITPVPMDGTVLVPAGTTAGTDPDFGAFSLTLANNLFMDETEITKHVWDSVYIWAVTNGYDFNHEGFAISNNHPVTTVNWYDCVKWCNARSEMEGIEPCYSVGGTTYRSGVLIPDVDAGATGYRLPTGEEWEYAARGGVASRFAWGNQITHNEANYFSSSEYNYDTSSTRGFHPDFSTDWPGTSPAGTFAPNGYGLYDVSGNVAEWCWDEDVVDGSRYMHDGSWIDGAEYLRCGSIFLQFPDRATVFDGFRTVRKAGVSVSGTVVTYVDARDYTLSVISQAGTPAPAAGFHVYAWGSTVTCSVDPVVIVSNTVYVMKGWTGSGSVPAEGSSASTGLVFLSDPESSIVWNWIADNDQDDLPNDWELKFSGSETGMIATADTDGDGYTAAQEFILGTDPTNGLSQPNLSVDTTSTTGAVVVSCSTIVGRTYTIEYTDSLTPSDWSTLAVFSGTGLVEEYEDNLMGTNRYYRVKVQSAVGTTTFVWKTRADTDGDELPNDWEQTYFASEEGAVASLDSDNDGYTNLDEFRMGSDPTNPASHLNFTVSASGNGTVQIFSSTAYGRIYVIEYTDSLSPVDWRLLGGYAGTGEVEHFESSAPSSPRYYRMRVEIPYGVEL